MLAKIVKTLPRTWIYVATMVVFLAPVSLWARPQEESSSKPSQIAGTNVDADGPQADNSSAAESSSAPTTTPGGVAERLHVRGLGSARWVRPEVRSQVHFGPIFDSSASLIYAWENGPRIDPNTGAVVPGTSQAVLFTTDLVYDKTFRRSRFAVQYRPEAAFVNGKFEQNLSNHSFNIDTTYLFSRRWSLNINDVYRSYSVRSLYLYGSFGLDVDRISGNVSQNPFLQNSSRFLANEVSLALQYQMSARDQFVVSPHILYQNATYATQSDLSGINYGTQLQWNHMQSPTRTFDLYYRRDWQKYSGAFLDRAYDTLGFGYDYRVRPTWSIFANVGATTASDRGGRQWTVTGSAVLRKDFRASSVSLAYYRGEEFGSVLSSGLTDRVDLKYARRMSSRWHAEFGVGHEGSGSGPSRLAGSYAVVDSSFRLSRRFSWFVNFGHRWLAQNSTAPVLGATDYVASGIRWESSQNTPY